MGILGAANYLGVRNSLFYGLIGGAGVWLAFLLSGVHVTIAGVLVALTIPARTRNSSGRPIINIGVFFGLVIGKILGITFFTWLFVKLRIATMPPQITWKHVSGIGLLAGVGFTMSIFITALAFTDPKMIDQSKYGILLASLAAAILGVSTLRNLKRS